VSGLSAVALDSLNLKENPFLVQLSEAKIHEQEAIQKAFKDDELINCWIEQQLEELKQKLRDIEKEMAESSFENTLEGLEMAKWAIQIWHGKLEGLLG
jgi:uncharacterized protein involved in exopolysaccharide biosynthesis